MSQLDAHLFFAGDCAEAMRFYERTLGGRLETMTTYAEAPVPGETPPGMADRVMHARLRLDGRTLMAADALAGSAGGRMSGFAISLVYASTTDARRVFAALAEGGTVRMPMQKTFWVEEFGMLVDRFGTPWMINGGVASA